MKNKSLIFIILAGILSSVLLVYFYIVQRNFTQNHREFILTLSKLDNTQSYLKSSILQSSIYAYASIDEIAKHTNNLQKYFDKLAGSKILKSEGYEHILIGMDELKKNIKTTLSNVENYNMLNAAIKNSLVFLTRHTENALKLNKTNQNLYIKANEIVQIYRNTKSIQDLDYLNKSSYLLSSKTKNKKVLKFIKKFNLHSVFLFTKFPKYMKATNNILNNPLTKNIDILRDEFSQIALNDFRSLDRFAFVLFLTFLISIGLIISLMIKIMKKHSELQKTASSLEYSLNHDILTKQYNRFAFERDLEKLTAPHLLILNINGFKKINDIYGNETGNNLLKQLSDFINTLTSNIKNIKTYRIGGDEFGFLFENINSNYALEFAYLLEEKIAQHTFQVDLLNLNITVSIASNNIPPIFENADLALKEVKKDSTINVIKYKESLNLKQSIEENLQIIDIIKKAIKHDRVVPYFQPIVNLETSIIEKYECLVRIVQDNGEILPPFKFLEISKKTPYYHEITKIMIEKAIKIAKEYPLYRFSINISMIDILDQGIVDILFNALNKDFSVSSRIDIELLESENLEHIEQVQNFITRLHSYGSKILIDDFGSGYSNFSYFADLDVDIVKIDGSITSEITKNDRQLHMLKSIYQFSKGMGLVNVAEFVESKEIALKLKEIGITYAQGYYFSKPIPRPLKSNIVTI